MRRLRHFVPTDEDSYEERKQLGFDLAARQGGSYPAAMFVPGTANVGKNLHLKTMLHQMGTAAWWESDVQNEPNTRHLEGEIHLSVDLEPSCACKIFIVEVINLYRLDQTPD